MQGRIGAWAVEPEDRRDETKPEEDELVHGNCFGGKRDPGAVRSVCLRESKHQLH